MPSPSSGPAGRLPLDAFVDPFLTTPGNRGFRPALDPVINVRVRCDPPNDSNDITFVYDQWKHFRPRVYDP